MTKKEDKEVIEELKGRGYTQRGAEVALKSIKNGMVDAKKGRIKKVELESL